jgi:hypothetical protein
MRLTDGTASCQDEDKGGSAGDTREVRGRRGSGRQKASVADTYLHIRSHLGCCHSVMGHVGIALTSPFACCRRYSLAQPKRDVQIL